MASKADNELSYLAEATKLLDQLNSESSSATYSICIKTTGNGELESDYDYTIFEFDSYKELVEKLQNSVKLEVVKQKLEDLDVDCLDEFHLDSLYDILKNL